MNSGTEIDLTAAHPSAPAQTASVPAVPEVRFDTSFGPARVVADAAQIPAALRESTFAGLAKDLRYHEIAAATLEGQFKHRWLILENRSTGGAAVQPLFFVPQDILEGVPKNIHAALTWPRKFFPGRLRMNMLTVGCSAGDGLPGSTQPWFVDALAEALKIYAKRRASMILLKDFPAEYRALLAPFETKGYRRVPSMPACKLDFDFATFEEYMKVKLGRKLRYKYIKLNKTAPIPFEVVTDVTPFAQEIYELYRGTHERSKMRFERLTPEFFALIGQRMPDTARYFLWRVEGKLAAFALCLVKDGNIYHLNIGFDYTVSFDLQLYYVTIRDIFQWSLDQGLKHYITGQLNYDPKLHLKMSLDPLDLYSRHTSALINPIFRIALGFLQPVRHDPIIQQFPNVSEL